MKATTESLVGSDREVKAPAIHTEKGLQKPEEAAAVPDSEHKTLSDIVASLMEELSSI